ncbi:MAG: hypothetical protein ACE5KA_08480 [Nitrososphaerales archaeon]
MGKLVTDDFCHGILKLDKTVRFAAVADRYGKIIAEEYREGSSHLLSKEEEGLSVLQGAIRMGSRKPMMPKLGRLLYTFSVYEKVKRATIPLSNQTVLMVSFDMDANPDSIVSKKILPLAKEQGL